MSLKVSNRFPLDLEKNLSLGGGPPLPACLHLLWPLSRAPFPQDPKSLLPQSFCPPGSVSLHHLSHTCHETDSFTPSTVSLNVMSIVNV